VSNILDSVIMIESKLAALGLDEKEQRFYLAALQLGSAPVTEIANRAGVTRTNGYDLLQRLERRGLLTQISGNGARHVVAEDPSVLIGHWEQTRSMLDSLVPELKSLFNGAQLKPRIRFYEGAEGIEKVLWETLECRSGTLLGVLSMHELLEVPGLEGMQKYIAERVKRGLRLRVLRSTSRETAPIWPSSEQELRELRYAPNFVELGMTMYICDDTVSYLSSKRENYGLVIESREFSALSRAMFEGLWTISRAENLGDG
jgi:HTH-type transcriptional regulator, sugar sensing transcriptional regulator